jgi:small subunit ribosomal protein S21
MPPDINLGPVRRHRAKAWRERVDRLRGFCYQPAFARGAQLRARAPSWRKGSEEDLAIVQIFVRDNNVDQALKALKKKMQREGSFREMKRHVHYEKPSEKRARQRAEAIRRARKLARKRAQREGLIPAPPKTR